MPRPPGNPLRPTPRGTDSLLQDLWETQAWRLFPVFLVYVAGGGEDAADWWDVCAPNPRGRGGQGAASRQPHVCV